MQDMTTQARPYARAVFEFALSQNALAAWSDILQSLKKLCEIAELKNLLGNPMVSCEQLSDFMIALCQGQLSEQAQNFIKLLAESDRLPAIPCIADLFETYRQAQEQTAKVVITSAVPLASEFKNTLMAELNQKLGKQTVLHCEVDESLIGGLLIKSGDTVIDGSLQGELSRLKEALVE